MERAPAVSPSHEDEHEARLAGDPGDPGPAAVAAVALLPADSEDKVPLAAGPASDADVEGEAQAQAEDEGEGEEDTWEDEQEELGICSHSPWCHAFVYSVFVGFVTFFVLLYRQRL